MSKLQQNPVRPFRILSFYRSVKCSSGGLEPMSSKDHSFSCEPNNFFRTRPLIPFNFLSSLDAKKQHVVGTSHLTLTKALHVRNERSHPKRMVGFYAQHSLHKFSSLPRHSASHWNFDCIFVPFSTFLFLIHKHVKNTEFSTCFWCSVRRDFNMAQGNDADARNLQLLHTWQMPLCYAALSIGLLLGLESAEWGGMTLFTSLLSFSTSSWWEEIYLLVSSYPWMLKND